MDRLHRLNDVFAKCFEKPEIPAPEHPTHLNSQSDSLFDPSWCDNIRADVRSLHAAWLQSCPQHEHELFFCLGQDEGPTPTFKIAFCSDSDDGHKWHWTRVTLEDSDHSDRQSTVLTSRCVCKSLRDARDDTLFLHSPHNNENRKKRVKIDSVQSSMKSGAPIPIRSVLNNYKPHSLRLARRERFSIAASIAWMVLNLGGSPWLDRGDKIGEFHVFQNPNAMPKIEEVPFVTHVLGLHPDELMGERRPADSAHQYQLPVDQIQNRILFALALVFIELCMDRCFTDLKRQSLEDRDRLSQPNRHRVTDYEVACDWLTIVYDEAGEQYGNAVRRCLRCDFPGPSVTGTFDCLEFRQTFFHGVIAPIRRTLSLIPASVNQL